MTVHPEPVKPGRVLAVVELTSSCRWCGGAAHVAVLDAHEFLDCCAFCDADLVGNLTSRARADAG